MTEKADLHNDQVSLPPNYAPSETYTETPPPAYRSGGSPAVRVARLVCLTVLAMTLIIGFFVVTHKFVQERSQCDCGRQETLGSLHRAALFAPAPTALNSNLDNNKIEENIQKVVNKLKNTIEQNSQVEAEKEDAENVDENQVIDEEVEEPKDVQLPKDLLLGDSKMIGRNVQCKVQKRQRRLGPGIMTQAIIVTCDDDDPTNEKPQEPQEPREPQPIAIRPPMSLLNSIMKVLSSRPQTSAADEPREPRMFPMPMAPLESQPGPRPISFLRSIKGPLPSPMNGPMSPIFLPLNKIHFRRPLPAMEGEEDHMNPFMHKIPPPHPAMFPHSENQPRFPMSFPPQAIRIISRPNDNQIERIPFPMANDGPLPIRVIRLPTRNNIFNEEGNHNMPQEMDDLPMPPPMQHLMKLFPTGRKIIRLNPRPNMESFPSQPLPFPIPRDAFPFMPHPMPEASGRALPAPVEIPGVRVVRLPFSPQLLDLPEAQLMTHMEVRAPPVADYDDSEPELNFVPIPDHMLLGQDNQEFGPPKTHTVINVIKSLPNIGMPLLDEPLEQIPPFGMPFLQEPITQTLSQRRFVAPPPPRFASEGRISPFAQLNPEAEVMPFSELGDQEQSSFAQEAEDVAA